MVRKRLTERFPWLVPARQLQRRFCFYLGMRFDGNTYARVQKCDDLPYEIFASQDNMINTQSGYDLQYQYNKVHNLKLAAAKVDGLIIKPGEVFSFCYAIKDADKYERYLDGLTLVGGEIRSEYGGGLCQLSNLLYWLFLHTPMEIMERHGHGIESLPPTRADVPTAIDATIAEGWLDLKVKNTTTHTFQITIDFDGDMIKGKILSNNQKCFDYEVYNPSVRYIEHEGRIYEKATLARRRSSIFTGEVSEEVLYDNTCIIDYPLPEQVKIEKGFS